ncbi:MAG TPA: hypothetical protein VE221_10085 [Sphingomicrobium sp.]|nr:hypothetical protein [Sphingomicrobium sp.]
MIGVDSGAAFRLLTIPLVIGLLTSCGQQPAPAKTASIRQAPPRTAKDDVQEVDALIAATKQHPSLVDPKKYAGPPIHVDPYPHSRGAVPHPHAMK